MPNADDMVLFSDLVRAGSFSKAAKHLSLPKSTISRRIAKLEAEVGLRLLERNTRTMRLTDVGQSFLQHCNGIAEQVNMATRVVEGLISGPSGVLCVSASYSIGRQLLGEVVRQYMARCPNVKVRLVLSNRRVDLIEERFDVAIRVGPLAESNNVARRVGGSRLLFFASPDYLRLHGTPTTPEHLLTHKIMYMSEHDVQPSLTLWGPGGAQAFDVQYSGVINDFHLIKNIVLAGAAMAILPDFLCQQELARGELVNVLPDWSLPNVDFQVVYPSRQGMTPKLRVFLELLEAHLQQALPGRLD